MNKIQDTSIARNKRAYFDYEIIDKIECGLVLEGCEVKSIRKGDVHLRDSYAMIKGSELFLLNAYIAPFKQASSFSHPDPSRTRKLLLHKLEIQKWSAKTQEKGLSIIPLKLYFKGNRVKVQLGLCRPKKNYDKRKSIKDKDLKREESRYNRGRLL